jgi:hypothetical protein
MNNDRISKIVTALYTFFSGFTIPAYAEDSVPDDAALPYITYQIAVPEWESPVTLYADEKSPVQVSVTFTADAGLPEDTCLVVTEAGTEDTQEASEMPPPEICQVCRSQIRRRCETNGQSGGHKGTAFGCRHRRQRRTSHGECAADGMAGRGAGA